MKKGNPLQDLSHTFGFPDFVGSWQAYVLILVTLIYILLYAAAFIYEMRLAKFYENKIQQIPNIIIGRINAFDKSFKKSLHNINELAPKDFNI